MVDVTLEFWSHDRRFGIHLPGVVLGDIRRMCQEAGDEETGGILIGRYTEDLRCAEVTEASGPPADSERAGNWLIRGVAGLAARLGRSWRRRREYYLGEWHFHPRGNLTESGPDRTTMTKVSRSANSNCPEAVLLIATLFQDGMLGMRASVHTRSGLRIELLRS